MADTAEGTLADILALMAQRGVSPNSAENLNRGMLMLRGGPDQGFINDTLSAYADGVSRPAPRAQPATRQLSTRTPQPTPVSQDTAGGGGGAGRGATSGNAATTSSPASAVSLPLPPDVPPPPMDLTGEGTAQAPLPVANNPQLPANRIGRAISNPNADAPASDPYQPQQRPQIGGVTDPTGEFDPGAAFRTDTPSAPQEPQSDLRAPLRQMSSALRNGGNSETNLITALTLGMSGGSPLRARVASPPSMAGAVTPVRNPINYTPGPRVAPDVPRTAGGNSPSVEIVRPSAPAPAQAAPPEVSPEAVTAALRELLARPPLPTRVVGPREIPIGTQPAPVLPRTVDAVPPPAPPRAGPSMENAARLAEQQAARVRDAQRTGANARTRIAIRKGVDDDVRRSVAPGRQPTRRGIRNGDD